MGTSAECNDDENNTSRIREISWSLLFLLLLFHQRPLSYNFSFRTRFQNSWRDFLYPVIFQEISFSQHIFTEEDPWLHLSHPFDLLKTSEARKMFTSHSSFFIRKKRTQSVSSTDLLVSHISYHGKLHIHQQDEERWRVFMKIFFSPTVGIHCSLMFSTGRQGPQAEFLGCTLNILCRTMYFNYILNSFSSIHPLGMPPSSPSGI